MSTASSKDSRKRFWPSLYLKTLLTVENRVTFPDDAVTTLEQHEHIKAVEKDGEVKIQ